MKYKLNFATVVLGMILVVVLTGCTLLDSPPIPLSPKDLYVDANNGSDITGDGTQANRYKTITKAIGVANAGGGTTHTIHVAAGTYNATLGEGLSLELISINLLGEGAKRDDVRIIGRIYAYDNVIIKNIHCYRKIYLTTRHPTDYMLAENISITPESDPGNSEIGGEGRAQMTESFVDFNGLRVGTNGEAVIRNNEIEGTLTVAGGVNSNALIENNHFAGGSISLDGCAETMTIIIRDNTFTGGGTAITAGLAAHAMIDSNSIQGCSTAIEMGGWTETCIQNNNIEDNVKGIVINQTATVDLGGGSLGSAGENIITGNGNYNVEDYRASYTGTLYAKNNTWNDPQPARTMEGSADNAPNYFIENEGNSIIFSD